MTNLLRKEIRIPAALRELHGERATAADLLLTYGTALLAAASVLHAAGAALSPGRQLVLGLLTLDIAGGVTANFTPGTNAYYAQRPGLRLVYILLHTGQPAGLGWLFPAEAGKVALFAGYTLLATLAVNGIRASGDQRRWAAAFTTVGVLLLHRLAFGPDVLALLLTLFLVKLVPGFAVRPEGPHSARRTGDGAPA